MGRSQRAISFFVCRDAASGTEPHLVNIQEGFDGIRRGRRKKSPSEASQKNRPAHHGITGRGFFRRFWPVPRGLGQASISTINSLENALFKGDRSSAWRTKLWHVHQPIGPGAKPGSVWAWRGRRPLLGRAWLVRQQKRRESRSLVVRPVLLPFPIITRLASNVLAIHLGTARSIAHSSPSSHSFVASVLPASSAGRVSFPRSSGYSRETSPAWHCASPLRFTVSAFLFESVTGQVSFKVHEFSCCL